MGSDPETNPAAVARRLAEQRIPPADRPVDWNERWLAVEAYCADLISGRPVPVVVSEEARLAIAKMDYDNHVKESEKRLDYQQEHGLAALKGLTIVNGGAIIGLLTFIGNASGKFDPLNIRIALAAFASGLGATLLTYVFGYLAQADFMNMAVRQAWDDQREMAGISKLNDFQAFMGKGNTKITVAIAGALTSWLLFALGAGFAVLGLA